MSDLRKKLEEVNSLLQPIVTNKLIFVREPDLLSELETLALKVLECVEAS